MSHQVVLDLGYYQTKVLYLGRTFLIPSKIEETSTIIKGGGIELHYNNKTYLVGEGAKNHNIEIRKYNNEQYKLIVLAILGTLGSNEYQLVVTYPLNYLTKQSKQEFENYLKTNEEIFTVNNKKVKISINSVLVVPQTASILYTNAQFYKNKIIGFLDWGGITVSGCIFNNLNIINESKFSEHMGSLYIFEKIKKTLNQHYSINIQDYEIPFLIENGLPIDKTKSKQMIDEILNNIVLNILQQCKLNKWNIGNIEIIHSGGTSILLKDYILQHFPNSKISDNPIYDNCWGAMTIAKELLRHGA